MIIETKNCVVCGKPAVCHSGNVRLGRRRILAGLCKDHRRKIPTGFLGHYQKWMNQKANADAEPKDQP